MFAVDAVWTPEVENVTHQTYGLAVNGEIVGSGSLPPEQSSYTSESDQVTVNPGDSVTFTVNSVNEAGPGTAQTVSGKAPTAPNGPTGLSLGFRKT